MLHEFSADDVDIFRIIHPEVFHKIDVLKACVHYFLTNIYFSPNDSPSKTMKYVFYFI